MDWDTHLFSPPHKIYIGRTLPHPSTQFQKCFVGIMYQEKLSLMFCLHLGPLSPSNSATYSCSLQYSLFQWHLHSLKGDNLAIGTRFPAAFRAAKSCSEVWFPVPDSYGQGIKAPVMLCGEGGHGSTFVALRLHVCGTYSEMKEPEEIHHLISSTTLLLCPFVRREHKNICFLCWNMFTFKSGEWIEHQGNSVFWRLSFP